jgi:hypothetical protein
VNPEILCDRIREFRTLCNLLGLLYDDKEEHVIVQILFLAFHLTEITNELETGV